MTLAHTTPTTRGPIARFTRWLHILRLRWRIADVESAIDMADADRDAEDARMLRRYAERLRAELRAVEAA